MEGSILNLSDSELASRWRLFAASTNLRQETFCSNFELNIHKFNSWLLGRRNSPSSRYAVQQFLYDVPNARAVILKDQLERIKLRINDFESLLFVNADKYQDFTNLKGNVLLFFSPKGLNKIDKEIVNGSSFNIVSLSDRKDSADQAISIVATELSLIAPRKLKFIFVSTDNFLNETVTYLENFHNRDVILMTNIISEIT